MCECMQMACDVAVVVMVDVKPQKVAVEILICRIKLQIPLKWLPEFSIIIYVYNYVGVSVCISLFSAPLLCMLLAAHIHSCSMYVVDN